MTIRVLAPAKVNLGLEIIRKREDGFHDIATVFQTLSIFDRLDLEPSDLDSVEITSHTPRIESNLALRALDLARQAGVTDRSWRVELSKRIPIAAGLGGASSDAAGVLAAIANRSSSADSTLESLALDLGSDVPFLLRGGAALATSRGERITALPPMRGCWFVLVSPSIEIDRKTARLYGALRATDFSDGTRANRVAQALSSHRVPSPMDLKNAFERPLEELIPSLPNLVNAFHRSGAPFVALSGAGPSHYTLVSTLDDANRIASNLQQRNPVPARVMIARPTACGPIVRHLKTVDTGGAL